MVAGKKHSDLKKNTVTVLHGIITGLICTVWANRLYSYLRLENREPTTPILFLGSVIREHCLLDTLLLTKRFIKIGVIVP